MKELNERFSEETLRELTGIYVATYSGSISNAFIPSEEPLTIDNFGIFMNGKIYTADDFRWREEDGNDRNFTYEKGYTYLSRDAMPDEVCSFLDTIICIKFATNHLTSAQALLDATDNIKAKQAIDKAIAAFKATNDNKEKFQIAADALNEAADALHDVDYELYDIFYNASIVVSNI